MVTGLAGQSFAGPSFFAGRLSWYKACTHDAAACATLVGPWRYRLSSRTYQRGAPGPISVHGFTDTGTRLYEIVGCPLNFYELRTSYPSYPDLRFGGPPGPCAVTASAPPAYEPHRTPSMAPTESP